MSYKVLPAGEWESLVTAACSGTPDNRQTPAFGQVSGIWRHYNQFYAVCPLIVLERISLSL